MPDQAQILHYTPPKRLKAIGTVALCIAAVIVALGLLDRVRANQNLAHWTDRQAIPTVSVISLSDAGRSNALVLPGDVQAFDRAPVYSRVTGYLAKWYTDIGTVVKSGQKMAEIDIPDLDQQLAQAKANLNLAIANENLAAITAKRWRALLAENAIAPQATDEKVGAWQADIAATAAARAAVAQLDADESFKTITAPFDGVVTSRSTDIGALITVGVPTEVPLFTVSDEHSLRIYVHVPQNYSSLVRPGMTATFTVPQYPGRVFTATLATTADAVDALSGTLLCQFQIDNADHALKPGDYAQVQFDVPSRANSLLVPASALIFRDGGMSVATVGQDSRIIMKRITIGRDLGNSVEVSTGLSRDDRVVNNPPDSLEQGNLVRIAGNQAIQKRLRVAARD
jgi:RND family efflux transporter MFP subunit